MARSRQRPTRESATELTGGDDPELIRAEDTMLIRSEERVLVDTQVRVAGRAVLRKYVVTETMTQTFQVRHEEVRLEQATATSDDAGAATPRAAFADGVVIEMVLHREVPKVVMEVVAAEVVRLHVDTVADEVSVSDTIRKEQVSLDPPAIA